MILFERMKSLRHRVGLYIFVHCYRLKRILFTGTPKHNQILAGQSQI